MPARPHAQYRSLQHRLRSAWQRRGPLAWSLRPLAALYGAVAGLQRGLYQRGWRRRQRLPVPVVVVGNVLAGGVGKTPVTLAVVAHLQASGWQPGILSRGYGRKADDTRLVDVDASAADVGDEPLLLRRHSGRPVAVARQRAAAGRHLLAAHPDVDILVCDDGLQHHALARDVEICVFDGRGTGNGWLLPAGPLREPWPRAVDLVLLTEPPPKGSALQPGAAAGGAGPIFQARRELAPTACNARGECLPLGELAQRPVVAVAAIGRPEAFFAMLQDAGLTLARAIALPDHHDYAPTDAWMHGVQRIVCTEKDAVKLQRHRPDAFAVGLKLQVPAPFFAALDARLPAPGGRG